MIVVPLDRPLDVDMHDEEAKADRLLDEATELDEARPTYYGSVWIALARLWLDTDLLSAC